MLICIVRCKIVVWLKCNWSAIRIENATFHPHELMNSIFRFIFILVVCCVAVFFVVLLLFFLLNSMQSFRHDYRLTKTNAIVKTNMNSKQNRSHEWIIEMRFRKRCGLVLVCDDEYLIEWKWIKMDENSMKKIWCEIRYQWVCNSRDGTRFQLKMFKIY